MKIAVAGLGYVGLSNAALLAQHNDVTAVDIDASRVALVNERKTPFHDDGLADFFATRTLNLSATLDADTAYAQADYVVVATPTDYDPTTAAFDTSTVESVIAHVTRASSTAIPVVRSTVPVGFCASMQKKYGRQVIFAPEFLREGKALHDSLHPSRVIVGDATPAAEAFARLLVEGSAEPDTAVLMTSATEAESIKLFSNTYLAMRVAFFNELDTFAASHGLSTAAVIEGVCLEPRIGPGYNNPSFGYGGYCLPKDTKQLLTNYRDVPQRLIEAIVHSNSTRMDFVADEVLARKPRTVGIHRLVMKAGSDNFRASSVLGIVERLEAAGVHVIIYEPALTIEIFNGLRVEKDLTAFKAACDVIVANRLSDDLDDVAAKVYSRDVYRHDS